MITKPGPAAPAVVFQDAAVQVAGRTIWSDVNLSVRPGEFIAVLGPNGVGKSTLVKTVLGLVGLSAGSVTVLGQPAGQAGKDIGYLPQRRSFDSGLRVRGIDIVRLGGDGERWGVPLPWGDRIFPARRAARDRVREVVELVGATAFAGRPIALHCEEPSLSRDGQMHEGTVSAELGFGGTCRARPRWRRWSPGSAGSTA